MQFMWDVDALWAVWRTLVATYAVVGLAQLWHTAVVTNQIGASRFAVIVILLVGYYVALIKALVVV